jgi:hypothetical protein
MDRIDELNIGVGKIESINRHEDSLHTGCLMKCLQEMIFLNLGETLLWLDEDDPNNTMGAFLGLV